MKIREWFDSTKVENHPKWLRRFLKDPFSVPPIYGDISPAGGCNHRCLHCAPSILDYRYNYIGLAAFSKFFRDASDLRINDPDNLGIRSIQFAGEGEPMLESQMGKICAEARLADIDVAMLSNGTAFTEARAYEVLPNINIYLQFSINAGLENSYTRFHQTNSADWDRVWENIRRVVRIKRELKSNCEIGVNMTVTVKDVLNKDGDPVPANWTEVEPLINKARDAGADYVCFKPYSQLPQNHETFRLFGEMSYGSLLDGIIETGNMLRERYETKDFEVIFRFNRFKEYEMPSRPYNICRSTPTLWFYLQSDGLLVSCQNHWLKAEDMKNWRDSQFYLGNINRQSLKEIWYGDRRKEHLKSMETFDISVCRKGCHPDRENGYLHWLSALPAEMQEAELRRLENKLSTDGLPHRGNII